jgi:hypothetical protein
VVDAVLLYFGKKRIRVLILRPFELWWNWDDISNALEIPAETLLNEFYDVIPDEDRYEHERMGDVGTIISMDTSMLKSYGFGRDSKDLESTRFMSHSCLSDFVGIHEKEPAVSNFARWLEPTLYEVHKTIFLLESLCQSVEECCKICFPMEHLVFQLNEETLRTQIARLMTEVGLIQASLNIVNFSFEKDSSKHAESVDENPQKRRVIFRGKF